MIARSRFQVVRSRFQVEPIRAWKLAFIRSADGNLAFSGYVVGDQHLYQREDTALCLTSLSSDHRAPAWDCGCGFYGMNHLRHEHLPTRHSARVAILDVELYGRVIRHTYGYRAEKQRVLRAMVNPHCRLCGNPSTQLSTRFALAFPYLAPVCDACPSCPPSYSLAEVAGLLGVEVGWGAPDLYLPSDRDLLP